jgi:hypothetical protein
MGLREFEEGQSMQMKLDDVELIKRVDKDGAVEEIRSIHNLSVYGKRRIVELPIPGSVGNVFQDMGRNPLTIFFDGELIGPNAMSILEDLESKFELKEPVPFSSDITTINNVTEVVIEDFAVHFASGLNLGIRYTMVLKEHKSSSTGSAPGPGETEPPSQKETSKQDIQKKARKIFESVKSGS